MKNPSPTKNPMKRLTNHPSIAVDPLLMLGDRRAAKEKFRRELLSIHKRKLADLLGDVETEVLDLTEDHHQAAGSPKPVEQTALPNTMIVGVIVRGEVSHRIYTAWSTSLPKRFPHLTVRVSSEYLPGMTHLVADSSTTKDVLVKWLGDGKLSPSTLLVLPGFMVQLIKSGALTPPDASQMHRLALSAGSVDDAPPTTPDSKPSSEDSQVISPAAAESKQRRPRPQYACITTGGVVDASNSNRFLTDILEELQGVYELCHDEWRAIGYKKCVAIIKQMPRITEIEQLNGVKGIGSSMRDKIQEILLTGSLRKLSFFKNDPKIIALYELMAIWGVGEKTASSLMRQGYLTIKDLRERGEHLLTAQQKVGLRYYEELQVKIPRTEVQQIEMIVASACKELFGAVDCTVCGSYRRGKPASGDVDVLITPAVGEDCLPAHSLSSLIHALTEAGFLTDHLSMPGDRKYEHHSSKDKDKDEDAESDGDSQPTSSAEPARSSYMGVCQLSHPGSLHRRIDIKTYPRSMKAFATLYFTGSDHFNRSMRLYAKRRGFQLSDKHLVYRERIQYFAKQFPGYTVGEAIPCVTEQDVFTALLLPYKAPTDRNVFDIDHLLSPEEKDHLSVIPAKSRFMLKRQGEDDEDEESS